MKIPDNPQLEIAIPSPNNPRRTSYVLISRGKSRFVDENCISQLSNIIAPVRSYTLNMQTQKIANLARRNRRLAQGHCCGLGCKPIQHQETGCGLYQRFFQRSILVHKRRTIPTTERKWQIILASSSYG